MNTMINTQTNTMTAEQFIDELQKVCDKTLPQLDSSHSRPNVIFTSSYELINNNKNGKKLVYNGDLTIKNLIINSNNTSINELFMNNLGTKTNNINNLHVSLIIKTKTLSMNGLFKNCSIPNIILTIILNSDVELTDISSFFSQNVVKSEFTSYDKSTREIHIKNTETFKLTLSGDCTNFINNYNGGIIECNDLFSCPSSNVKNLNNMFSNSKFILSTSRNDIAIMDFTTWSYHSNPINYLNNFMYNMSNVRFIDMSNWNVENCLSFAYCFANTPQLRKIYIDGWKINLDPNSPCNYNNPSSLNYEDYQFNVGTLNMFENCGQNSKITSPVKIRANGLTMFLLTKPINSKLTITTESKQTLTRHFNDTVECLCAAVYNSSNSSKSYILNIFSVQPCL